MVKLIYSAIASLDGYVEDAQRGFDWAAPNDELFRFINERERPIGTYLYGRRMYETMKYWETYETDAAQPSVEGEFAEIWRSANKIVYSSTLSEVSSSRTTINRDFNVQEIRRMKETSSSDITIGGAQLASHALNAGLIDEVEMYLTPIIVGVGKPAFANHEHVKLDLLEERRFSNGELFLRYDVVK